MSTSSTTSSSSSSSSIATAASSVGKYIESAISLIGRNKEIIAAFLIADALFGVLIFRTRKSRAVGMRYIKTTKYCYY